MTSATLARNVRAVSERRRARGDTRIADQLDELDRDVTLGAEFCRPVDIDEVMGRIVAAGAAGNTTDTARARAEKGR